jgi:hypothetical protein
MLADFTVTMLAAFGAFVAVITIVEAVARLWGGKGPP